MLFLQEQNQDGNYNYVQLCLMKKLPILITTFPIFSMLFKEQSQ